MRPVMRAALVSASPVVCTLRHVAAVPPHPDEAGGIPDEEHPHGDADGEAGAMGPDARTDAQGFLLRQDGIGHRLS